jgi:hypothetical protein
MPTLADTFYFMRDICLAVGIDPLWLIFFPYLPILILMLMMAWFLVGYPLYLRNK